MSLRRFRVLWRQPRALCEGKFCCTDYRSPWASLCSDSHSLSCDALLLCWFIVTQVQFNCKGEIMLRMTVVSASQKKVNNPAVSSAELGSWLVSWGHAVSAAIPAALCASLSLTVSCLIKVFLSPGGLRQLHYTSLNIRNRCLWVSTKGKTVILEFGTGNLATKLRLKVYMKLSPDRSMIPKVERSWVPRSVQTGTKPSAYLSGSLPSFGI